jgi:hypothetical protein
MADRTVGSYDTITPVGTEKIEVETAAHESKNVTAQSIANLVPIVIQVALSTEADDLNTGDTVVTFRAPRAMTITEVRASLGTEASSDLTTFDVNVAGVSILSTKVTIDATEKTSVTAATPAVISTPAVSDDAEITVDIDTVGTGAKGAKLTIIGVPA